MDFHYSSDSLSHNVLSRHGFQNLGQWLDQKHPPRAKVAATLNSLNAQLEKGLLNVNYIVQHFSKSRFLPYNIGLVRNKIDVAMGKDTNASTVGELIVSEECIRGTYELCIAFLEFIYIAISSDHDPKPLVASVVYILNEIYPNHHLWIFKNPMDMKRILYLCTQIFHQILSQIDKKNTDLISDLVTVTMISLSQGKPYERMLDVIVSNKDSIKEEVEKLKPTTEGDLRKSPHIIMMRQSIIILSKLLTFSHLNDITEPILMENVRKALDRTQTSLANHLFSYIYQEYDPRASCLAVMLIRRIAKKFSMSLMASLGLEADKVCEFFLTKLEESNDDTNLNVALLDLLATCVHHQPGLIELFLNSRKKEDSQLLPSIQILTNILKNCTDKQEDTYKLLHAYLMKFLLNLWQRHHSAINQFDKCELFWRSLVNPILKHIETVNSSNNNHETCDKSVLQSESQKYMRDLNEKLISCSLMILAREVYYSQSRQNDPKLSVELTRVFQDMSNNKFLSKFAILLQSRHVTATSTLQSDPTLTRLLTGWRDFLITSKRYEVIRLDNSTLQQLICITMECTIKELHLGEHLVKDRCAIFTEILLLLTVSNIPRDTYSDALFKQFHDTIYLINSCRDYVPLSAILSTQACFNHYLICQKEFLKNVDSVSNLIPPILDLLLLSFRLYNKQVESLARLESRLCFLSATSLKNVALLSTKSAPTWYKFLKIDHIVQFLATLFEKRLDMDVVYAIMDLIICFVSIPEASVYMHKSGLIEELKMIGISPYTNSQTNKAGIK